jgi:hypothetical protein
MGDKPIGGCLFSDGMDGKGVAENDFPSASIPASSIRPTSTLLRDISPKGSKIDVQSKHKYKSKSYFS